MKIDKTTLAIGLVITLGFSVSARLYLQSAQEAKSRETNSGFFKAMESLDLRYNDVKYRWKKPERSAAPVALIAIDDDTVKEIERWPWGRDMVADMTQRLIDLGVKSVAFDAIFSEPQKGGEEADAKFGAVVAAHPDRVIMGVFSEERFLGAPYQDICVTESFLRNDGEEIVKLNPTFVVDDSTPGALDELPWKTLFDPIFASVAAETQKNVLFALGKDDVSKLKLFESRFLGSQQRLATSQYCNRWLTADDEFLKEGVLEKIEPLYMNLAKSNPEFASLDFDGFIARLKSSTLSHPVPQYSTWAANIPALQKPAAFTASFVTELDADGYIRRYPLFFRSGNRLGSSYIPSLALQSYLLATGYRADVKIDRDGANARKISSFSIVDPSQEPEAKVMDLPIDSSGQLMLSFYGPQMAVPYVSAKELFSENKTMHIRWNTFEPGSTLKIKLEEVDKADFFKDRSVVVGATAVGLYDLRNMPLEANYPGPEIHMTMLANLLEKRFLKPWSAEPLWLPVLLAAVGVLLTLALLRLESVPSFGAAMLLAIATVIADFWVFLALNIKTSGFLVLGEVLTIYFGVTVYKYFTEERKKRELKSTFAKYVSPSIVEELLKEPENLKLGGRRQRMTAFFSDVRGFTTISEKLPPEQLSDVLNRYLSPMTEIVFENKGTLDKYMGDAIMAFFGAPVPYDEHALYACRCALKNLEKLKEIQEEFKAQGLPLIDIGIGINTGQMSVGNMGSNIVRNYTVMGDSVNLASRLEGINKEYGTRIVISEFTYADVKDHVTAREIDRVKVKGKNEPVKIFELIQEGAPQGALKERLDLFARGYALYMEKRFAEAKSQFEQALKVSQTDPVSELFVERCEEFLAEPPPADWDGVYVMKTK